MTDKDTTESPDGGYDNAPATGEFPAYQPPPPAAAHPGPPKWSEPGPTAPRRRGPSAVGFTVGVTVAFALGLIVAMILSLTPAGDSLGLGGDDAVAAPQGQTSAESNLQQGAVFVESNAAGRNEIVAFARSANGKLREVGRYPTGGAGSGGVEDASHGLVLGTSKGETSPINNINKAELLFVPNSGSDTITVFRVRPDRLELVTEVSSGGQKPVSLTVNNGLLYVLNSGEFDDRFVTGPTSIIENCTTGQLPSVTGFRVSPDGHLTEVAGSTRLLTGQKESGCAQVSFSPDGKMLIATERIAGNHDASQAGKAKGAILTWQVRQDGTLGGQQVITPAGHGPFGFTFTKDGTVLMVEQNGGAGNAKGGLVTTYAVNSDCGNSVSPGDPCASLAPVGKPRATEGTDSCWIAVTTDDKLAFVTSPFGGGTIASYQVEKDGTLSLLYTDASAPDGKDAAHDETGDGILDVALSRDNKYLYTFDILVGVLFGFEVHPNGSLSLVDKRQVFNLTPLEFGGQGGPEGISVF